MPSEAKPSLSSTIRRKPSPAQVDLPNPPTLDRFRTALRFSLWTWALYWPGGGLLLMWGGLDPISILITLGSLVTFIAMMATGALKADSSHTMKEFLLERPLYLVAALALFIVIAAVVPTVEGFALLVFATTWFGGLALATTRLVEHVRAEGTGFWHSKADQLLVVFAMTGFFSALVFLDALIPMLADGATLGSPSGLVAASSWANLLYPGFVLLASRPFREPLKWVSRKERAKQAKVRKAKAPVPFRAS